MESVKIIGANVLNLPDGIFQISDTTTLSSRIQLQNILIDLLGSNNVYFQPPPTVKMLYPCIVYKRDNENTSFANNKPYKHKKRYQITVMDINPDSVIPDKVRTLRLCSYDRSYASGNLNHDVFNLFF